MPAGIDRLIARIEAGDVPPAAALRQDARHFDRLSTGEAERLRGHILAAFERNAPDGAIPVIREELRTSLSPVVLAGAARAIRGLAAVDDEMRTLLQAASDRIGRRDEHVAFGDSRLTAREEIAATLARHQGPATTCCARAKAVEAGGQDQRFRLRPAELERVIVEDQSEARTALVPLLRGRTSLIAFFYTRCMNPEKCSLTVTRLAAVARRLATRPGINVFALSYDSRFDTAARLYAFGRDRGFEYGDRARLMRCAFGWPAVRRAFRLQVGYGQSTVNAHARELFAVGPDLQARGLDAETLADHPMLERELALTG
jgi:protein SCO1/2